ncbi:hypothetical protein SBRY_40904 [Actinacidiphila bryophytorum]|uniref:Uncharacterized protein n=1 Tax=Actinacidiphila bryophytorum TaxID=1436133 RepID=A0A9W4H3S8_9ACTN|nr:hypothetical protein SBRY_40904 [Actinacidiphila bryophytorum]
MRRAARRARLLADRPPPGPRQETERGRGHRAELNLTPGTGGCHSMELGDYLRNPRPGRPSG